MAISNVLAAPSYGVRTLSSAPQPVPMEEASAAQQDSYVPDDEPKTGISKARSLEGAILFGALGYLIGGGQGAAFGAILGLLLF